MDKSQFHTLMEVLIEIRDRLPEKKKEKYGIKWWEKMVE